MKRRSRNQGGHRMIWVRGNSAFSSKREHHLRADLTNASRHPLNCRIKIRAVQTTVRKIKNLSVGNLQDLARSRKFLASHGFQLPRRLSLATVARSLTWRETNHVSIDSALVVE